MCSITSVLSAALCSPSGTFANTTKTQDLAAAVGCSLCPTGTFRSGDAAPENNVCRTVPPGVQR